MIRDDKTKFMLFIEPTLDQKAQRPMNDEYTMIMRAACSEAKLGTSNYDVPMSVEVEFNEGKNYWPMLGIPGVHTCCDGIQSADYDLLLPGGFLTNTLCVHYLMFFREQITLNDWNKIKEIQRLYGRAQNVDVTKLKF